MIKCSKAELIARLQEKAKELGRTPRIEDAKTDPRMPPYSQYYTAFNSWNGALEIAGLTPNINYCHSKAELIAKLQQKARELGRTPRIADIMEDASLPSYGTFQNCFGTWNKALENAGLYLNKAHRSREEGVRLLQKKAAELGRSPKSTDVDIDMDMPPSSSYIKIYGRWNNALKAAGLEPIRKVAQ